ncbi:MAG: hypothetical protein V1492_04005, partial [Candidatus Micrarchaeota archaeon]
NTMPYLRYMGDTGCGKSRALDVFSQLCYNYIAVNGAANSAPIYRIIEKWRGTLGFEEGDFRKSDETNELIKVINCGWERGRPIIRCEKNHPDRINFFDPYCPKVFATRQPFEDAATEGRCLTHIMQETTRYDIPSVLPASFYEDAKTIRNKLLCFRLKNYKKISADNILPLPSSLEPRLRQLATPLSMVFADSDEDWKMFLVFLSEYQRQLKEIRLTTIYGQILLQFVELANERDFVICQDIANALRVSTREVSNKLRSMGFDIVQTKKQVDGKRKSIRAICITAKNWERLVNRYLPEPTSRPLSACHANHANQLDPAQTDCGTLGTEGTLKDLLTDADFDTGLPAEAGKPQKTVIK